jgi:hypothetical protein
MPGYRAIRPGDLLAVRSSDPNLDEVQVTIRTVADNGDFIFLAGDWGDRDLEVVIRRVGGTNLHSTLVE